MSATDQGHSGIPGAQLLCRILTRDTDTEERFRWQVAATTAHQPAGSGRALARQREGPGMLGCPLSLCERLLLMEWGGTVLF